MTELLYLKDMQKLECSAAVIDIRSNDKGQDVIVLDRTVFYPQGGGQPFDTGEIQADDFKFRVNEVRYQDTDVFHIGEFIEGKPEKGDNCVCHVNGERRRLNTRLHSGGHVIDMAIDKLGIDWKPIKAYHFPDGPHIEYEGELTSNIDEFIASLNNKTKEIVSSDASTAIKFMNSDEMSKYCRSVPDYIPKDKPGRIVLYGNFGVPCGGTHVANLRDVESARVTKIKVKSGKIKVSYSIS